MVKAKKVKQIDPDRQRVFDRINEFVNLSHAKYHGKPAEVAQARRELKRLGVSVRFVSAESQH